MACIRFMGALAAQPTRCYSSVFTARAIRQDNKARSAILLSLHQEMLLSLLKLPLAVRWGRAQGEGDRRSYVPSVMGALAKLAA